MTKEYLEKLSELMNRVFPKGFKNVKIEFKHFFSGAACYREGKICGSLTPKGLALKFSAKCCDELISSGRGEPLRYFATLPVKNNYVLFPHYQALALSEIRTLFDQSLRYGREQQYE